MRSIVRSIIHRYKKNKNKKKVYYLKIDGLIKYINTIIEQYIWIYILYL